MAIGGTPVGNMIIKVDLDSVGVEKSMTGLQRQLKSSNTAMGAQLSAFDRGGQSTKKYGVLIDGLSSRHRIQARMVEEARIKYSSMSDQYGENSVKAQQAAQSLNEQISRYQETGRELDSMTSEFQEFQRVQEIQSKGWYKVADGMDKWGGKMKVAGQAMDQTGKKLTRGVTVPLAIVGGLAIKTGADFESGMSKVGAVSGASADEMVKLEAKARDMGATTVFSAKEASDAFYYMSLAGWDATEMMDGISGVMDLAAASGEDLASVSDIVTDGLTAFGKSAKDSGRMADILAAASANANTDVKGLGAAFSYVAPVAGALGYTMEDTSKAIGLMANSGIKSTKAGTALRTMMTNLSKPTAEAKKAMDKYGISLTDSEGNMKSFDDVMGDLRKGVGKLDKEQQAQAASTIFGKEAMSGALAIINTSEEDYKKLTKEINESDGAAAKMAETMQDNLAGSVKELKSMVEDLFIEMYQNLKPTIEAVVEQAKELTKWFSNLSPETQANIVKFGLLAAAMGPVLSITGKLTFGIGGLMQGAGALTKSIGLAKGAGLAGSLASLGPLAVAGVAVAGIAAVSLGVYKLAKKSKELEEVNLDVAKSLTDQAVELENSANTFDKLSSKAKLSNEQLAELNDLNIRISKSSNPGEINELQKQYDALAKKSGLSKDELILLFEANGNIIDQTPEVKTSVSEQGNAFAENTDAVKEYIATLHEMTLVELENQRLAALENEVRLNKEITKQKKEALSLLDEVEKYNVEAKMSDEERKSRIEEINGLYRDQTVSEAEKAVLMEEQARLANIQSGHYIEVTQELMEQVKEKNKSIEKSEEDLALIKALDLEMANIVLKQVGINEEGDKGLAKLDETLLKNSEELVKLDEKLAKNGKLTEKEQERYDKLVASNEKHEEAKTYLNEELGIYKDLNSLAEGKLNKADAETKKKIESLAKTSKIKVEEGNIVGQIQKKNTEYDKGIQKLEQQREKEGANKKEIDKQITALQDKKTKNDEVIKKILIELGVWDDVKASIESGTKKEKEKGDATTETKGKLDSQGNSIDNNNKKTDAGVKKEKDRSKEAGKDVDKKVDVDDYGTVAKLNMNATERKEKFVTLNPGTSLTTLNREASSPVSKVVNFIGKGLGKLKFWAKGTPPSGHPGGNAVLGDGGGSELAQLPDGRRFLSAATPTLYPNLPKGTHVIPHRETERLLKSAPRYAKGTNDWQGLFDYENLKDNEFMKLLALNSKNRVASGKNGGNRPGGSNVKNKNNEQLEKVVEKLTEQVEDTKEVVSLLAQLLLKDTRPVIDRRSLSRALEPDISMLQSRRGDDHSIYGRG